VSLPTQCANEFTPNTPIQVLWRCYRFTSRPPILFLHALNFRQTVGWLCIGSPDFTRDTGWQLWPHGQNNQDIQ